MFHRLTSLFYGETEEVCTQGPDPSLTEKEDDGWLIVDFPEGQDEVQVESSPLENLLIEHPSMSVYAASNTNITLEEDANDEINDGNTAQHRVERWAAPAPAAVAGRAGGILEKASQIRRIQRAKQRAERRQLSRNHIQRQNLVKESRFHRAKRHSSFVYQPCRRQYNH
ncbi:tumor protein p53-inducible nuclear protein 2 isoform X2 [Chiloscyllium plagiosum]|uniref:tumor protein p53-inducible nuclear protein 2 isoform X2 n=1 Tax=Chiloscyllium plagiosum TaxID=36176 RepID=UPI001CB803C0|nr:tumor protein p53-inducible nuclear protein 2 isoform X2 [Chiloscyllium plagiosum]